eukprot:13981308-Alexandrium_andersonii.AAC.1
MWPEPGSMEYRFQYACAHRDILSKHIGAEVLKDLTRARLSRRCAARPPRERPMRPKLLHWETGSCTPRSTLGGG